MLIVINSGSVYKGGAEQVVLSFIHECIKFPQYQYHIIIAPNLVSQINQKEFPDNFTFHLIKKRPASSFFYFFRMMLWYKRFEKEIKPDCVISTGGHGYWRPKAPLVGGFNIPHYIYPESPYFLNISFKRKVYWKIMKLIHIYLYNRLDAIIVQTEDVKQRLENILHSNAPIYVVSNTINAHFLNFVTFPPKLPIKRNGEIRLLTLSSYYPHKNLEIIKIVTEIMLKSGLNNFRFIVTLPQDIFNEKINNKTGMIINVGPIPIKECPSLYQECDYMFLPTLLECFSASYAEAMIMKKPILTSDYSFAHTVCGDAAVYFNPLDPDDIINTIISLSKDKNKQKFLIEKGENIINSINTPHERATKFLEICNRLSKKDNK